MSLIPVKVLAEIRLTSKPAALVVKALNFFFLCGFTLFGFECIKLWGLRTTYLCIQPYKPLQSDFSKFERIRCHVIVKHCDVHFRYQIIKT